MDKPTIFFSHSSLDKEYISLLKGKLSKKTAKTIEIFQSSDGESIPFGNNWVHKVEESLNNARIMLVFVSPLSMASSWIYFEAGYSYSKDVRVIPIGICGIDVGQLRPPLNLLQGFNISNSEGLNNLITVINREFGCDFEEGFTEQDYMDFSILEGENSSESVQAFEAIDYIYFEFPKKIKTTEKDSSFSIKSEPLKIVEQCLNDLDISNKYSDINKIHAPGIIFSAHSEAGNLSAIKMKIDPYSLLKCNDIINSLCLELYEKENLKKFWCNVIFNNGFPLETTDFKVSSRLHKFGLQMSDLHGGFFKYDEIDFTLSPKPERNDLFGPDEDSLRVVFDAGSFQSQVVIDLVAQLMNAKVIG
ncbi:toll/interleukin-1 receptor domain-containing protein [Paraferrimonas sp. SM1919]|uniref:toll/interleukin-1 receptor domain-containing protein n=1 Tax=Paraferrimonas sp. SM1919 TaxID=2662263 RepID=UPI0013D2EEDF|nr:toll/interleukin-1 receptor domain-containing protein [Paraferrimonas sp. SM1919]